MTVPTRAEVTDEPLDLAAHEPAVADRPAGAVVSFQGVVRDHDHGRGGDALEYEGHPSAAAVLARGRRGDRRRPGRCTRSPSRTGSARWRSATWRWSRRSRTAHRAAAFAACARLVDEVKARLPIWKRQVFADGTDEWVNCPVTADAARPPFRPGRSAAARRAGRPGACRLGVERRLGARPPRAAPRPARSARAPASSPSARRTGRPGSATPRAAGARTARSARSGTAGRARARRTPCRSPVSVGYQIGGRSALTPGSPRTAAAVPTLGRPRLASRRRIAASASTMIAGMTQTRWCDQEIGLITFAVSPTRVNAVSSSPSAWALAARDSPSASTSTAKASQSRPGVSIESYSRASRPGERLVGGHVRRADPLGLPEHAAEVGAWTPRRRSRRSPKVTPMAVPIAVSAAPPLPGDQQVHDEQRRA